MAGVCVFDVYGNIDRHHSLAVVLVSYRWLTTHAQADKIRQYVYGRLEAFDSKILNGSACGHPKVINSNAHFTAPFNVDFFEFTRTDLTVDFIAQR